MNSSRLDSDLWLPSTGKMFVWSPAFLLEPGSTRYSSAPSITTVWSNYQTSYNDCFEVYISETVTSSPYIQNGPFDQFNFIIQCHVTNRFSSSLVKSPSASSADIPLWWIISIWVCECSDISCWSSVKSIMDDQWQWLSFNAKLACNK